MPHCQFDSDYRISVFSSSFGPEQSADYRVGDSFGKYIFDPMILQLSLRLLRRYPNPQVGTTLNTFRPAATHQFYAYRTTRVKSEKFVTKFGESLNLVMFLVNISVRN